MVVLGEINEIAGSGLLCSRANGREGQRWRPVVTQGGAMGAECIFLFVYVQIRSPSVTALLGDFPLVGEPQSRAGWCLAALVSWFNCFKVEHYRENA